MNKNIHLVHAALDLRQGKEYAQSAILLQRAIQLEPEYTPAYIFLGLVYQDQEKFAEAEAAFRQALHHEPENPEALQCLGLLYLSQERYPEAIANLEKHLKQEPENETSLDVLVPLLVQADRALAAEVFLRAAWEKTKDNNEAVRLARFLIGQEKLDDAHQFLNEALQNSEQANLFVELALVLVIQQKYSEANDALLKAIALRPDYDRAYRGLAHCYTQLKQGDKAIEYAERALAIDPRHYRNWQAKADALILLERYEDAIQAANKGIQLIKDCPPIEQEEARPVLNVLFLQRFNAQQRSGQLEEAVNGLSEARREFPEDERFTIFPIHLLIQSGQPLKALELVDPALFASLSGEALGQIFQELMNAGIELYQSSDYPKALKVFETLAEYFRGVTRIHTALAYFLTGDGELGRAEEQLNLALGGADPEERGICLCDLGYIQLLRGHFDQAENTLQEVLELPDSDAFLRIAFWMDGQLLPDYKPHPTRSVSTHWGSIANLAALALTRGDLAGGQMIADQLHEHSQHACTSNMILGCVAYANSQMTEARQAWEAARGCAEDQAEVDLIQSWLARLAG